jgi:hypothetical protein
VPSALPGKEQDLGEGWFVDLGPETCWFTNVRYCVRERHWERLRRTIVERAGARCDLLGHHGISGSSRAYNSSVASSSSMASSSETLRR